jgi:hypothetical protein
MAKTKERISDVKPYVERAVKNEELRENVLAAFNAAREVYNDLVADRGVTGIATRVARDKDIQDNVRKAVDELREAADRLQGKDEHKGRNTMLLLAGITIGVLFNPMTGPSTRQWIKDKVLGPSDDFTYGGDSGSGASTGTTSGSMGSTASGTGSTGSTSVGTEGTGSTGAGTGTIGSTGASTGSTSPPSPPTGGTSS